MCLQNTEAIVWKTFTHLCAELGGAGEEYYEQCSAGAWKSEPASQQWQIADPHPNTSLQANLEQTRIIKYTPAHDSEQESNLTFTKNATK